MKITTVSMLKPGDRVVLTPGVPGGAEQRVVRDVNPVKHEPRRSMGWVCVRFSDGTSTTKVGTAIVGVV